MTTRAVLFGLLVGWLGGALVARLVIAKAADTPAGRLSRMAGRPLDIGCALAAPRLVSVACGLALAVAGLWALAGMVVR